MTNKKKIVTSVIAVAMAVVLLVGGTFAWQSISQQALNEKEAIVNPGGRLHDDFNGENKDVYVENFADDAIFARIRLDEYFEITLNKGTPAERTEVVTEGATRDELDTYITHLFGEENATDEYWQWTTGGSTVFMPTFNKNKDSLAADVNGTFANNYEDYVEYEYGDDETDNAIYDNDSNNVEDENVVYAEETHYATNTSNAILLSMDEWMNDYGSEAGDYWVYDTDGWVYYAKPIEAGEATGLLLDGISLKGVMDDSYYYAINVVGQFITADDLGKDDATGFYADGQTVSDNALALLEKIGVNVGNAEDSGSDEPQGPVAELQVALYDEDGTKVAGSGAGSTLAPNSTYDIVGTLKTDDGEYVVYDTRDDASLSEEVDATVSFYTDAYDTDYSTYNCINGEGKLVTGDDDTFDHSEIDAYTTKYLKVCGSVSDVTVNEEAYSNANIQYNLYPNGKEVYEWTEGQDALYANPNHKSSDPFKVFDGNGNDITDSDFTFDVEGATDSETKLEKTEDGIVFTVGSNETASEVYLVAKNSNGQAKRVFWPVYQGTLSIGDVELTPGIYSLDNLIVVNENESVSYPIVYKDFYGNVDSGATIEVEVSSGGYELKIEDGNLIIPADCTSTFSADVTPTGAYSSILFITQFGYAD